MNRLGRWRVYSYQMFLGRKLPVFGLVTALGSCVATAQLSKFADPGWNPNTETNKVSNLAGKSFGTGAAKMGDRSAKLGDSSVKLKSFPVKQWSTPESSGVKERPARLPGAAGMPLKSSPYADKSFNTGRVGDMSKLQKSYPTDANKMSGKTAGGLNASQTTKSYQGKVAKDLQATVDRTFHRNLTVDEVKTLLNEPGSSLEPTAEVKDKDQQSLLGQGVSRDARGLPTVGPAARVKGKSRHASPGR